MDDNAKNISSYQLDQEILDGMMFVFFLCNSSTDKSTGSLMCYDNMTQKYFALYTS